MYSKKIIRCFMGLAIGLSLFAFAGCAVFEEGFEQRVEQMVDGIMESAFEIYEEFGLIFDSETRTLYYGGEEVVFFEDRFENIRGLTTTTSGNRNANGLHIEAQRDDNGNLVGLEVNRR
ncbi:MAG: hypothetical protein FWD82_05650 [Defluviitaleaceae bacterium]|nr:hypothetical protein [Defluviitaleaceae bacterium]